MIFAAAFTLLMGQDPLFKPEATIKEEAGFLRASFVSTRGTITVILPSDIAQGDTISGTYFPDAKAKDVVDVQIDLGKSHGPPGDISNNPRRKWDIPKDADTRLSLTVWTPDGFSYGTTYVSVATKKTPVTQFTIPNFARIGSPCYIAGPLDGDAENTTLKATGVECPVVAECPRGAVAIIPSSMKMGLSTVEFDEFKQHIEAPTRFLSVLISTPRASISLGEPSTVTLKVDGLMGVLPDKLPMIVVENQTPKIVDLQGKLKHFIVAKPNEEGVFMSTLGLNRVAAGKFAITAVVDPGPGTKIDSK